MISALATRLKIYSPDPQTPHVILRYVMLRHVIFYSILPLFPFFLDPAGEERTEKGEAE